MGRCGRYGLTAISAQLIIINFFVKIKKCMRFVIRDFLLSSPPLVCIETIILTVE